MGKKKLHKGLIIGATAVAMALAVSGVVWTSMAAQARSNVEVLINPDAIKCKNPADALSHEWPLGSKDEPSYRVPALKMNSGFDCTLSVIVRNTGRTEVSLKNLTLSGLGQSNSNGAHSPRLMLNNIQRIQDGSVNASFAMDFPLGAGQSMELSAALEPSAGCMSVGGWMGAEHSPSITVAAYGLSGIIDPRGPSFALLGTEDSSCEG